MASHLRDAKHLAQLPSPTAPTGRPGPTGSATGHTGVPEPEAFAVVLYFDEFTEHRVRQAWAALDQHGVPSAASTNEPDYRPHITLAIVNTPYPEQAVARLRLPLANVADLPVSMTALGFFLTNRAPAYLSVAPTTALLKIHDSVHSALGAMDTWAYYRPGNWMPHCTLAMDVVCQTTVAEALSETALPIHATVGSARMVELPKQHGPAQKGQQPTPIRGIGAHRRAVEPDEPRRQRREVGRRRKAI